MLHPKRLLSSFRFAIEGLFLGLKVDQNLQLHFVAAILVMILSYLFKISQFEFLFVMLAIAFVIFAELINTAIEEMTNLIIQEHRQEAKIAKDVSAAAVLFAALFALVVGLIVFLPKLMELI